MGAWVAPLLLPFVRRSLLHQPRPVPDRTRPEQQERYLGAKPAPRLGGDSDQAPASPPPHPLGRLPVGDSGPACAEFESMIRKLSSGKYRLYSRKKDSHTGKRRNLGTFATRGAAARHERAVQFFKRRG